MLLPVNLLLFELKCISKETQTLVIERLYEEKHSFPEALKERYHQKIIDKKLPQPPPNPKKKNSRVCWFSLSYPLECFNYQNDHLIIVHQFFPNRKSYIIIYLGSIYCCINSNLVYL